ncbi:MAG: phage distal tail protein [Acidimicrobiales bacterium]
MSIYADTASEGSCSLPSAGGGLSFPLTFPRTYGAVATGGTILAVNAGSFDTGCTFRIDGPAVNPKIESVTAGKTLAINITLLVGEFLVIDTQYRTVLLGGTTSRYSSLDSTSRWFSLAPGTNEIAFRAATSTVASLTAVWRSAWL